MNTNDRFKDGVQVRTVALPQGARLVEITDKEGSVRLMLTDKTVVFTELISPPPPLSKQVLETIGRVIIGQLP